MVYYDYRPTIRARGGIRAQSRRGDFGSSWWAQRWLQTLENFRIGARLSRGRSYARRGQVLSVDVEQGVVNALVQGSRKTPYRVTIEVDTISAGDWEALREEFAQQPIIAASLISGRMPDNIEDAFRVRGLSMFPDSEDDLETDCTCPDWSNPCKHVAAVYLLLGEEFDRDPFLIFRLRGMEREELLGDDFRQSAQTLDGPPAPPEPLPADPDDFWANPAHRLAECDLTGAFTTPDAPAALPRQLGRFPFWQGEQEFVPALQRIYQAASRRAIDSYTRQAEPEGAPPNS
ncbi:MAG: SWIM zinc finger family protein [Chloroflexota bacterium]|nr:SWIM zinc finger family protein [Chloroflexota bacterium]MDE2961171.1 SWIM zinc finger family protein [Chloroflexota bacterium]